MAEDNSYASDRFNRQIKYDDRKRQYCEQNGISLECIKYTASNDQERLEKAIKKFLRSMVINTLWKARNMMIGWCTRGALKVY